MIVITPEIIALILSGALLRALVGVKKSLDKGIPPNRRRMILSLTISVLTGIIAVLVFDPSSFENKTLIVVVAFAGVDAIEAAYAWIVKGRFGISDRINYDTGGVQYYTNLTLRQKRAVDYLRKYGRIRNDDYQRINRVSHRTATRDLDSMAAVGVIKKKETGKATMYELT